jgi:8-oxo-dGTP diphosphatase
MRRGGLAFDHRTILTDGVERARAKLEYTALATAFVEEEFTIGDLRRVYEVVWGEGLDPGNFHRKVTRAGFLEPAGRNVQRGPGRPAALYRHVKGADELNPPLTRSALR